MLDLSKLPPLCPERISAALLSVVLDALGVFICSIDIDTFN